MLRLIFTLSAEGSTSKRLHTKFMGRPQPLPSFMLFTEIVMSVSSTDTPQLADRGMRTLPKQVSSTFAVRALLSVDIPMPERRMFLSANAVSIFSSFSMAPVW